MKKLDIASIVQVRLDETQYFAEKHEKKQIVIHHTVSGPSVFLLVFTASENIKSSLYKAVKMATPMQTGLVFNAHFAVASEFVNAAVHLFSLPVHPSSSVATTSSPQTPIRLSLVSRPSLNLLFLYWGSVVACVWLAC